MISANAAFVLGYLYHGCLRNDCPMWLTKRVFDNGTYEIWGGVRDSPTFVGSWWTVSKADKATVDELLEAYATMMKEAIPNGFKQIDVAIVEWDKL